MSVTYLSSAVGQVVVRCLSTDTKPTTTVFEGAALVEEDTGKHFRYESNAWVQKINSSYGVSATMATKTYRGRTSGTPGIVEDVPAATLKSDLVLVRGDVGLGSVDNTPDAGKPVSTAQQTALDLKAPLASPTFTGVPAAPTAAAGTNTTQLASTAFVTAINNNSRYFLVKASSGSHIAARVAGNYIMPIAGSPLAVGGTGTLYPLQVFFLTAADFPTVNGITTKLRVKGSVFCNDVAPTGNFTFGLHPITRPATSGGAGLVIYTVGTVVAGSNGAVVTAPAADSSTNAIGSDFAIPADGWYALVCVTTATIATSAHTHVTCELQARNT